MSRSSVNHSDRGSSQPNRLDGTNTHRTRRSGHSGLSRKNAELIVQSLKNIQHDVERIGEDFRSSLRGLSEEMRGPMRGRTVKKAIRERRQRTKRVLGDTPDSVSGIKAHTAELLQGSIERTHTCVSEIASTAMAPAAPAAAQAATQRAVMAKEEGGDNV